MSIIKEDHKLTNESIEAHLCVIGGGVTGLSIALTYAQNNPDKKVVVLESGFEKPGPSQQAAIADIIGNDVYDLAATRIRAFGGTQWVWGGNSRLFDRLDFQKRDWMENSGWPIEYDDYLKYVTPACKLMNIDDFDWSNIHPKLNYRKLIDSEIFENCHYKLSPQIVSSHPVDFGHFGQSHREALEKTKNLTIYLDQTVINLEFSNLKSRLKTIQTRTLDNRLNYFTANQFVVATGAIENGRLMKYWFSKETAPNLPCYDSIGRYFMEHPHRDIGHMYTSKAQIKSLKHYVGVRLGTAVHMARFKVTDEAQRKYKLNGQTVVLSRQSKKEDPKVVLGQSYKAIVLSEQEPIRENKVELLNELDIYGIPKMELHWKMTDHDYRSINFIAKEFPKFVAVNDLGRARGYQRAPGRNTLGGHHHMGTTRMGASPNNAVVDGNCKVFGLDNMYMAGGSVFSTSGSVNPTLNMVILGQRLVNHLNGLGG